MIGRALSLARAAVLAAFFMVAVDAAAVQFTAQAEEIEGYLNAFPKRALSELAALLAQADGASADERRLLYALYGQSMIAAGVSADALALAGRMELEAGARQDKLALATARLIRANVESRAGDSVKAIALAKEAEEMARGASDTYLGYWAAMTVGVAARGRGRLDESVATLQTALSAAETVDNAYRRSHALYQLAMLYVALKQPQDALEASRQALKLADLAGSPAAMVNARMAESAAMEYLDDPVRELSAMTDALAIARKAGSSVKEGLVLINLADIRLRRKEFNEALVLSRQALAIAREFDDAGSIATSKANMGFALFGLGRAGEGKRLADEALVEYERTGATAEIAALVGEYSLYLEKSGDYKAALALYHRERRLNDEIAAAAHQKVVLEMQGKYESERRRREIELLNRQNALNSAELENRALRERLWWLLAAAFAISFVVIAVFYRKLRVTNGLLALKNRELSVRSSRDPLTALYNRRYFQDFMRGEHGRPERRSGGERNAPVHALLLIDIDLFKQVNDRYGHAAGDAVLVVVARRLRDALRETDMIVRWGGEEFLVFIPAASTEKLDEIATRIMDAIASRPIVYQGNTMRVTVSVGYAPMPLPPNDLTLSWERAVSLVDMALYMAKVHGRNRAYGIHRLLRCDNEALAVIERDLEKAWETGMVDLQLLRGPGAGDATDAPAITAISPAARAPDPAGRSL